jgi:four helix bundle protein
MGYKYFEDLPVWQLARNQHHEVVILTALVGFVKDFKLKDQIRSAAGSVMDNIAEGFGRAGNKEFINFLTIARGSNDETRSQVYQAHDRGYVNEENLDTFVKNNKQLSDQLTAFIQYLQNSEYKGTKFKRP